MEYYKTSLILYDDKEFNNENLRVQFVVPKSISCVENTQIVDVLDISFLKIETQ